ncbi:sodium channel modifier 1-like [Macadamia integrifolia]|uniref:sodium channel modifier 1-like n=1 Tax=Macadamia integrifolia TaxID=60698 RepID=UPI001C4F5CAB|nr:sodium channel modifier 1-like [Macadamia integrifolia]XP_042507074.1 sodium channel modifier 1-like [Macadamia integrifolia]XP_042507075.1 sodium channel modifier 1-like [Macadamia integrifolia]XP_042507076.1 sodium channel modifier 1-like [Macadamia integrifolia]
MSVFGGDSWAREAQHRKRRVEDLMEEGLNKEVDSNPTYKKLCNGKYTCHVCPHHPILDSSLMLSMHCKGSCHSAALSKFRDRELRKQEEITKRMALSDCDIGAASSDISSQQFKLRGKPLIEQTRKARSEALCNQTVKQNAANETCNGKLSRGSSSFFSPTAPPAPKQRTEASMMVTSTPSESNKNSGWQSKADSRLLVQQQLDFRERQERELKFTAAGWKRDCHGRWFRDENVEFDSDEEDPNVCLV